MANTQLVKSMITSSMISGSYLNEVNYFSGNYYLEMYNSSLKVGGEDDDDSNDYTYLKDHILKMFKDNLRNKDLQFEGVNSHEKGHFTIIVSLLSEKKEKALISFL
jgi:hypothetical protein